MSVLFALGEADVREAVRAAHDRAVREALGYVERTAAAVRRGAGGCRVEPAGGFIAAAFRHRTPRAGDPQLHTHVLVDNLAQGLDRRWSTLDGRRLYAHARATSFIYQAVLRSDLTREVGVRWLSVRDGIAEIAGVPKPVLWEFGRRRADIEAALELSGTWPSSVRSGCAGHPTGEGPAHQLPGAPARLARTSCCARVRTRRAAGDDPQPHRAPTGRSARSAVRAARRGRPG